jgi:GT2 family glycosyltransferase
MTEPAPQVAILLLNYNGLALTQDCLRSLRALEYPRWRAIVVDNGSTPDQSGPLREEFADIADVVRSEEALGFCGGNNLAMRAALAAGADHLLLLNNDTTVEPDFLAWLVRFMASEPRVGIAGPKLVRYFDRPNLDAMGGDVNLWTSRHVNFRRPYAAPRTDLTVTHGAAFLIRRGAAEQVGFLDEDYYAYWEESDYCLRARAAGWRIGCEPRAVVYHKVGQTNRFLSNFYIYYMVRNGFLILRKNGRWYQWPSFTLCFLATSVAKYAGYLLLRRPRDLGLLAEAIGDFLGGRLGRKTFRNAG